MEVRHSGGGHHTRHGRSRHVKHLAFTSSTPVSTLQTVTPGAASEPKPIYNAVVYRTSSPIFSPDGSHIAFFVRVFGGRGDVWVMKANGSGAILTANNSVNMIPGWTPDASAVLYTRYTGKGTQAMADITCGSI